MRQSEFSQFTYVHLRGTCVCVTITITPCPQCLHVLNLRKTLLTTLLHVRICFYIYTKGFSIQCYQGLFNSVLPRAFQFSATKGFSIQCSCMYVSCILHVLSHGNSDDNYCIHTYVGGGIVRVSVLSQTGWWAIVGPSLQDQRTHH